MIHDFELFMEDVQNKHKTYRCKYCNVLCNIPDASCIRKNNVWAYPIYNCLVWSHKEITCEEALLKSIIE